MEVTFTMRNAHSSEGSRPGKVPEAGLTVSQLPPEAVAAEAVQGMRPWVALLRTTDCEGGLRPPGVAVKFRLLLLREIKGAWA